MYDARASAIRSRIDRLDVPARAIFSSPAGFKREALPLGLQILGAANFYLVFVRICQ